MFFGCKHKNMFISRCAGAAVRSLQGTRRTSRRRPGLIVNNPSKPPRGCGAICWDYRARLRILLTLKPPQQTPSRLSRARVVAAHPNIEIVPESRLATVVGVGGEGGLGARLRHERGGGGAGCVGYAVTK